MTAHPWFTAIVALWFAALLGLSSLVLAPAMLERIVAESGIDSFIAAAAPPLGQTARLLVALGLAGLGGVLGLILGRFIAARAKFTRPGDREVAHAAPGEPNGDEADTFGEDPPGLGLRNRLARLTGQGDGPRDFADLPKLRARDCHPVLPAASHSPPPTIWSQTICQPTSWWLNTCPATIICRSNICQLNPAMSPPTTMR